MMTTELKTALKTGHYAFNMGQFDPLLTNPGKIFYCGTKTREFPTKTHASDIIMSYDITHRQISVYKQGVVSQLPELIITWTQ